MECAEPAITTWCPHLRRVDMRMGRPDHWKPFCFLIPQYWALLRDLNKMSTLPPGEAEVVPLYSKLRLIPGL